MVSAQKPEKALELFYSYAHRDERWRKRLEGHLSNLRRQGFITEWHDRDISAGTAWASEIDIHLNTADIILLLISPDFISSEYCYSVEMMRAIGRHEAGEAYVIPIILRPTDYQGTPFEQLQALPTDAKPVTKWPNPDEALLDIVRGIRKTIEKLSPHLSSTHPSTTTSTLSGQKKTISSPPIWNVPYRRNPFFIGRDDLLKELHDLLTATREQAIILPQAISGLGGIGKTQIAVEYAFRYSHEYRFILWMSAATRDTLISDFVAAAKLLHLPERDEQDQNIVVAAVKLWLTCRDSWLLILDNVENLEMVYDFLPTVDNGHILLTTRIQAVGSVVNAIEVEKMREEDGILLLLRRAKLLPSNVPLERAPEIDRRKAEEIVREVDGLPLAIDQAGAYIEETGCSISSYLDRYRHQQTVLLSRRGGYSIDHPESVATTWSLSFKQIEQIAPIAADLLRFCAFLAPDAIPEEMIVKGVANLSQLLQPITTNASLLDETIGVLRRFSLLRRNTDINILTIHRLVQAVIKESMDGEMQCLWAERTVRAVNSIFPDVTYETWSLCQRYLQHAQVCMSHVVQYSFAFPEAARLLNEAGRYLYDHAQYTEYAEAEQLYQRALAIREQILESEHPDTATTLNNLADLYLAQKRNKQAEQLYQRALAIREQVLGSLHSDTAISLSNLARFYRHQGKFERAEPLYQRALAIQEQILGFQNASTAMTLYRLAFLYYVQGKYDEAEILYQRSLAIRERVLDPSHPETAMTITNLARLYYTQGRYEEAEVLYERALSIREQVQGPQHPETASVLNHLARLYFAQGQYKKAEALYKRALSIREQILGFQHPDTATSLNHLAFFYSSRAQYEKAEPLYQRALSIRELVQGPQHPLTVSVLKDYADLLRKMKRDEAAAKLETRIKGVQSLI